MWISALNEKVFRLVYVMFLCNDSSLSSFSVLFTWLYVFCLIFLFFTKDSYFSGHICHPSCVTEVGSNRITKYQALHFSSLQP